MTPTNTDLLILRDSLKFTRITAGYSAPLSGAGDFLNVVVILGSSRSGSSLLFQVLSSTGSFFASLGEETPIFRTAGLGWVRSNKDSDVLSSILSDTLKNQIRQRIFCELGRSTDIPVKIEGGHIDQLVRRILWQWPDEDFKVADLVPLAREIPDWTNLIQRLGLEPGYYDIPGFHSARRAPLPLPEWFIEEPPFIVPTARTLPTLADLRKTPVLLKTSTHAYRIPLLKTLFPQAKFHWIVLTRNPAACINGLMDGWLSNAFHSHNLRNVAELNIEGYTSVAPQADHWWKFDLPPGWIDFVKRPLPEVCAFQWRSAYSHILSQIQTLSDPVLMVKHEDLVNPITGSAAFQRIFDFIGVKPLRTPDLLTTRPIMASVEPAPARWRRREQQILPQLASAEMRSVAERLHYDLNSPQTLL